MWQTWPNVHTFGCGSGQIQMINQSGPMISKFGRTHTHNCQGLRQTRRLWVALRSKLNLPAASASLHAFVSCSRGFLPTSKTESPFWTVLRTLISFVVGVDQDSCKGKWHPLQSILFWKRRMMVSLVMATWLPRYHGQAKEDVAKFEVKSEGAKQPICDMETAVTYDWSFP